MKQRIIPVALIVTLIVLFFIICQKGSNRYDGVQGVQTESLDTSNPAPAFASKQTASAAEIIYEESIAAEVKAVAETKSAPETMPSGTNSSLNGTQTDRREKGALSEPRDTAPAAVPLVTIDEAETLNAFALFLSAARPTVVEGEITERSELPDPQKSDYPNCRFTAHFIGNTIISGVSCPKELVLIIEGFENYEILETNRVKSGDKVQCIVIPFESLPEDFQSTQQSDDLSLFLLENYYVIDMQKINSFSDNTMMPQSGIFFSDGLQEYVSIFERHLNPPVSQKVKDAQNASIRSDLEKMNRLLNDYDEETIKKKNNKRFYEVWNEEKKKDPPGYNRVGDYVWRNMDNSFWCLPVNYTFLSKPAVLTQKTLDCFSALKEACESNGVQLIVSLIPNYKDVSSRVINKEFRDVPDLQTATFVKQFSEIGVEAIYSTDAIISNYNRFPFAFFFPSNAHPSDTAQDVNSDIIADRLKRYDLPKNLDPLLFSVRQKQHVYLDREDYLFPENCDIGNHEPGKAYTCREVLYDGKPVSRTSDAPIIAVGNSYMQTPMATPYTLPTLLSMKLSTTIDYYGVESFGPFTSIISQILTNPERFLSHRKALVMQFGTIALIGANAEQIMVNIREGDENRKLLNKKSLVMSYDNLKSVDSCDSIDNSLWKNLPEKHIYAIDEAGLIDVASFSIEANVDSSADLVCRIPAICFKEKTASLWVNGERKDIPTFYRNPAYAFITFLLPPETQTVEVRAEGKKGSVFAIKDIQIWQ